MNHIGIPCWIRPEMFYLCLESLSKSRRINEFGVYVALDGGFDQMHHEVIRSFSKKLSIQIIERPTRGGPARNVGEMMKELSDMSDDYFILIGDDMEVSADFFEVLDYAYRKFKNRNGLISIGARFPIPSTFIEPNPEMCYITPHYSETLVIKDAFERFLRPWLCEEYYETGFVDHSEEFFRKYFPEMSMNSRGYDGLLERVVFQECLHSIAIVMPRCREIGFCGAHKFLHFGAYQEMMKDKTLDERIELIKQMLADGRLKTLMERSHSFVEILPDHNWKDLEIYDDKHG